MRLRALLVDDEPLARLALRQALESHDDVEVAGECGDGASALAALRALRPDLLFLDVEMPGLDGFGLLEALPTEQRPLLVFVTAYGSHALQAFEAQAMAYLLKPLDQAKVDQALDKVRMQARGRAQTAALQRLSVRQGGRLHHLRVEDIAYVEAEGNYVALHVGAETFLHRESLASLEARLDPSRFLRIHRRTLVNVAQVKEVRLRPGGDADVLLHGGAALTLSRRFRERARALLA